MLTFCLLLSRPTHSHGREDTQATQRALQGAAVSFTSKSRVHAMILLKSATHVLLVRTGMRVQQPS